MREDTAEPSVRLLDTNSSSVRFEEALSELFEDDGTIYLVSGYFTYQGYLAIRDDIVSFLDRSRENRLVVVVGAASDQFSSRIAFDLWKLDDNDQVKLYKFRRGLHAKLYLRDGPNPTCILGSANITQVAFRYNVELNVEITRESVEHPDIQPFRDWAVDLVESSEPLRRRDIFAPVQIAGSIANWSNKARLLPIRNVLLRVLPVLLLLILLSSLFQLVV